MDHRHGENGDGKIVNFVSDVFPPGEVNSKVAASELIPDNRRSVIWCEAFVIAILNLPLSLTLLLTLSPYTLLGGVVSTAPRSTVTCDGFKVILDGDSSL